VAMSFLQQPTLSQISTGISGHLQVYLTKPTQPGYFFVVRQSEHWQWLRPLLWKIRVLYNSKPCY